MLSHSSIVTIVAMLTPDNRASDNQQTAPIAAAPNLSWSEQLGTPPAVRTNEQKLNSLLRNFFQSVEPAAIYDLTLPFDLQRS